MPQSGTPQPDDPSGPIPMRLLPDTSEIAQDGRMAVGGCDLAQLAEKFGTPLFVYDEAHLRARCREAVAAFKGAAVYATKPFLCTAMARLAMSEGMGLDASSEGELHTILRSFDSYADIRAAARRVVFHGNNKSTQELRAARRSGVGRTVVDSFDELGRLDALHLEDGIIPEVLIRVTPDIAAGFHDHVQTGLVDSKFGFDMASQSAEEAIRHAAQSPSVKLVGLHCHIASQVFDTESLISPLGPIAELAAPLFAPSGPAAGCFSELSVGGGLAVPYVEHHHAPTIPQWAAAMHSRWDELCGRYGLSARLTAEPGRAIVASAAVTLYTVGTIKEIPNTRTYVSVDGGLVDNPRPMLYGSDYTAFVPTRAADARPKRVRIVGKHCESGDVIADNASVPESLRVGDVIATPATGAYGYSMAAPYNRIGRPAVVFVSDGAVREVIRRETVEHISSLDVR